MGGKRDEWGYASISGTYTCTPAGEIELLISEEPICNLAHVDNFSLVKLNLGTY